MNIEDLFPKPDPADFSTYEEFMEAMKDYFKKMKVDVFDSDHQVKLLYEKKSIIKDIKQYFPAAFSNNTIDKKTLADIVFKEEKKLKLLESLIHESLKKKQQKWIRKKKNQNLKK